MNIYNHFMAHDVCTFTLRTHQFEDLPQSLSPEGSVVPLLKSSCHCDLQGLSIKPVQSGLITIVGKCSNLHPKKT